MKSFFQRRKVTADEKVVQALQVKDEASLYELRRLTHIRSRRIALALSRLMSKGEVVDRWAESGRRFYRLAK